MSHILVNVAWPYANGPRHIGHVAGFGVPSDVYARYERMKGNDVLMVSGTDEHGTPILGAAVALSFADCWNLVEQPLTYLTTHTELYPLSVVFNQLTQQSTGVEFAGAALYTLPALLIYLYFQNDILEGVQLTELK